MKTKGICQSIVLENEILKINKKLMIMMNECKKKL